MREPQKVETGRDGLGGRGGGEARPVSENEKLPRGIKGFPPIATAALACDDHEGDIGGPGSLVIAFLCNAARQEPHI